jgi:hypothetical protein
MSSSRQLVAVAVRRIGVILPFERKINGLPADQPRRPHKEILDYTDAGSARSRQAKPFIETACRHETASKVNQATLAQVVINRLRR